MLTKTTTCLIQHRETDNILILEIHGYCEEKGGDRLLQLSTASLEQKKNRVILDFAKCTVINSFGISRVYEIAERVVDDAQGTLVLCNLNELMARAFTMSGILNAAHIAGSLDEAVSLCKS